MFFALGAASSAIDALKALTSSKPSKKTIDTSQASESPFVLLSSNTSPIGSGPVASGPGNGSSVNGRASISPETMSALLDAQNQSAGGSGTASKTRHAALKDLFGQIDGDGDGQISKGEFEEALGAGGTNLKNADSVFGKLDQDGDGSVSLKELASALRPDKGRRQDEAKESDGAGSDPLAQLRQGATTTTVTNSDGSVTTSLTYADGSKVTMTSPASGSSSSSATSSYNFIEQMIQREAKAISSVATASVSMSA